MTANAVPPTSRPPLAARLPGWRRGLVPLAVAAPVFAAFIAAAWSPILADFGGDNAVYWLTANHYSPFGEPLIPSAHFARTSRYPPLYPWLLAATGGGDSILVAHLVTVCGFLAALVVLYGLYRDDGLSQCEALGLLGLFCLLRATRLETLELHSEHLYLLLSMVAVRAANRACASPGPAQPAIMTAAIVAAVLTRTAGIALAVALAVCAAGAARRHLRPWLVVLLLVLVLIETVLPGSPVYLHEALGKIAGGAFAATIAQAAATHGYLWVWTFTVPFDVISTVVFFALLAGLFAAGVAVRAARPTFDGVYAAAYALLVLAWPYPEEASRLWYPLLPLLLLHGYLLLRGLARRWAAPAAMLPWVFAALLFVFVVPDAVVYVQRFTTPVAADYRVYKHTVGWHDPDENAVAGQVAYRRALDRAHAEIARRVAPGDCVLATKPAIVALHANRLAYAFPPAAADARAFAADLEARGCRYALLVRRPSPSFPEPFYPAHRLRGRARGIARFSDPAIPSGLAAELVALTSHPH